MFLDNRVTITDDLGASVGKLWKRYQHESKQHQFIVAAPISNTPLPIYQWVTSHGRTFSHWNTFRFLLMDEQVVHGEHGVTYVPLSDEASFEKKIKQLFLQPLEDHIGHHVTTKLLKPSLANVSLLDEMLSSHGGIDLLILALGEGGHYAQVMPGTEESIGFHLATLREDYKKRHETSGTFKHASFQPVGMSLGPAQVLEAKHIIVIISGEHKRELTQQLFSYESFDPNFPLSIIYDPRVYGRVKLFVTPDVLPK